MLRKGARIGRMLCNKFLAKQKCRKSIRHIFSSMLMKLALSWDSTLLPLLISECRIFVCPESYRDSILWYCLTCYSKIFLSPECTALSLWVVWTLCQGTKWSFKLVTSLRNWCLSLLPPEHSCQWCILLHLTTIFVVPIVHIKHTCPV